MKMTHHFLFFPMVCFAKFNYQFGLLFFYLPINYNPQIYKIKLYRIK